MSLPIFDLFSLTFLSSFLALIIHSVKRIQKKLYIRLKSNENKTAKMHSHCAVCNDPINKVRVALKDFPGTRVSTMLAGAPNKDLSFKSSCPTETDGDIFSIVQPVQPCQFYINYFVYVKLSFHPNGVLGR